MAFDCITNTANPDMVELWEAEEALAQANRMEDPAAMDIYEVRLEKGVQTSITGRKHALITYIYSSH
jgi:hypothetical protein